MTAVRRFLEAVDPIHLVRATLTVLGKALSRLWGRDVMLYVGGVSFFSLLAVFPGLALSIGLYGVFLSPERAALEAQQLAGRALLWDRQQNREAQAEWREARVPQKPYVYQTQA